MTGHCQPRPRLRPPNSTSRPTPAASLCGVYFRHGRWEVDRLRRRTFDARGLSTADGPDMTLIFDPTEDPKELG